MPEFWQHVLIAAAVILIAWAVAKFVDWRISRRNLPPEIVTRYRVLRRTIFAAIVFLGVMSALLVIPQVRAVAGGVLASSAVLALVIGFASQRTIGNFVAGILIAISQPLRLGDEVEVQGTRGVVEEIGLSYTWIRTRDNDRLVVPNERLASETIRNSTIRSSETFAEATVQVPADAKLREVVQALGADGDEVYVTDLVGENATVVVRKRVSGEGAVDRVSSDLRLANRRAPGRRPAVTPRRRRDDFDLILAHRGRKRKRADRIKRRRRAGIVAATIVIAIAAVAATVGLGAGTALSASCDLNTLRPVEIGQNSFVYASDGSLLGSIPAERNREPVTTREHVAVASEVDDAIEDRRFWEHGGVDYVGIARAAWKDLTAGKVARGRLDDHAAARPQPLHRPGEDVHAQDQGSVPRDQAREQVAEAEDPQRVPQHRLLRQPRVRRRGRLPDVLLQAREPS